MVSGGWIRPWPRPPDTYGLGRANLKSKLNMTVRQHKSNHLSSSQNFLSTCLSYSQRYPCEQPQALLARLDCKIGYRLYNVALNKPL